MRRYEPLTPDDPAIGKLCQACNKPFLIGDFTTLIALGPGDKSEKQAAARARQKYDAVAILVHWACATGGVTTTEMPTTLEKRRQAIEEIEARHNKQSALIYDQRTKALDELAQMSQDMGGYPELDDTVQPDPGHDAAWAEVIDRRLQEIQDGRVAPVDGAEVMARARQAVATSKSDRGRLRNGAEALALIYETEKMSSAELRELRDKLHDGALALQSTGDLGSEEANHAAMCGLDELVRRLAAVDLVLAEREKAR